MPTYPPNATLTPRLKLPRPGLDDPADGPDAFNDLTDVIDPIAVVYATGTTATRPPAGTPGRVYWNTDTGSFDYDDGAKWNVVGGGGSSASASLPILDVGQAGQIRAGRQLTVADFTALGLSQPRGLWNLSDLTNLGSDGRALANKGAVTFDTGINGAAATAARFTGSTAQALYIADSGAADPFRILTGSWGCWFRTAKRGVSQTFLAKSGGTVAASSYSISVGTSNSIGAVTSDGTTQVVAAPGASDVADDRWHFVVCTADGTTLRTYVDGVLEATTTAGPLNANGTSPVNVGGLGADGATAATNPFYGRVDEAFVTADVLSDDQVRMLYCAKLAHSLGRVPTRITLNVTRRKRGAALAAGDFPVQPLRLYNFTGGALTDAGSNNTVLANVGTAPIGVAGADGALGNGLSFGATASAHLAATDAGLPAALTSRSCGCWFKTTMAAQAEFLTWGTLAGSAQMQIGFLAAGTIYGGTGAVATGPYVTDGQWHFVVVSEDNAAGDGVRSKLYVDGRLVGGSTTLSGITLAGANRFRVGARTDGTIPFTGQIDGAFVTDQVLTPAQVLTLYQKSLQALAPSPKNPGDHVEAMDATSVLVTFDTLESQNTVDLGVAA